ncbi:hypothetical protein QTP70_033662 [Hemibagrus guttatus]|uniref:Uncharacterized protein n=1 Tax=Hemibagrus guttatus TaxID=175788 RepID=A0AAE0RGH8_9TELE|nr:hypothetical protein QTP70_033662 [Hemibagrus guttatus]
MQQQRKTRAKHREKPSPPPPPSVFEISTRNCFAPLRETEYDVVITGDSIVRHVRATAAKGKGHLLGFYAVDDPSDAEQACSGGPGCRRPPPMSVPRHHSPPSPRGTEAANEPAWNPGEHTPGMLETPQCPEAVVAPRHPEPPQLKDALA